MKYWILLLLTLMLTGPSAEAASCSSEYRSFMKNSQTERERNQEIKGAFQMNACQWNDYSAVDDQLDTVKEQFKAKAAACEDSSEEQETIHALIMERRFVREVVNKKADYPSAADEETVRDFVDQRLESLQSSFESIYVTDKQWVTEGELSSLFTTWGQRYSDRIPQYANCKEGPFVQVTESWNQLKASIQSLKALFTKKGAPSSPDADKSANLHENQGEVKAAQVNPFEVTGDVYESLKAREVDDPLSIQDAVSQSSNLRFDTVLNTLESSQTERNLQLESVDRMARYTLLYGTNGAAAGTDLQNLVNQMSIAVEGMTLNDLPAIESQLEVIYGKQCD